MESVLITETLKGCRKDVETTHDKEAEEFVGGFQSISVLQEHVDVKQLETIHQLLNLRNSINGN